MFRGQIIARQFDRLYSSSVKPSMICNQESQGPYYTAKDIEFSPNRAKEVNQNNVEETMGCDTDHTILEDDDQTRAYRAENSVSLYSVMQSNVPEPCSNRNPTHLNMPGSSSSRDCKYLSGRMQNVHQFKK